MESKNEAAGRQPVTDCNCLALATPPRNCDRFSNANEEALVAQCSTCIFFQKKYSHCKLHDSLTNAKYKCSGWEFKINKKCADEFAALLNHELLELRAENDLLRAALKPVLECKVMSAMTAEIEPGRSDYCAAIIEKAQRIYNEGEANQKEGGEKC